MDNLFTAVCLFLSFIISIAYMETRKESLVLKNRTMELFFLIVVMSIVRYQNFYNLFFLKQLDLVAISISLIVFLFIIFYLYETHNKKPVLKFKNKKIILVILIIYVVSVFLIIMMTPPL